MALGICILEFQINLLFCETYLLIPHLLSVLCIWILSTWVCHVWLCFHSCALSCMQDWNSLSQSFLLHLWDVYLFYNKCRCLICGNPYDIIVPFFITHSPMFTILNCFPDKIVSFIKIVWKFPLNLFIFMYMDILPGCISMWYLCSWCRIGHRFA